LRFFSLPDILVKGVREPSCVKGVREPSCDLMNLSAASLFLETWEKDGRINERLEEDVERNSDWPGKQIFPPPSPS
jgi:hypothetical protein